MPSSSTDPQPAARRRSDFILAAALAAIALAISPWAIEQLTGRPNLSARVYAISLTLDLFLLVLIAAALLRDRARTIAFHVAAWTFPLVVLAGLEAAAVAVQLSDRIGQSEDVSILRNWQRWPAYLLSEGRWTDAPIDERLYRPWRGDGIVINDLGLRTAPPTPKAPGEWRIAMTGGSAAWGWRVLDADTIPQQLQDALRRSDPKVTVYNFGIEGAQLGRELAVLKRFRAVYGIDQVIFYTGGNDVISKYLIQTNAARGLGWLGSETTGFELIKAALRYLAVANEPSPQRVAQIDHDVVASILQSNSLRQGIRAASAYCQAERMRCDFVLQPLIFTRDPPRGSEVAMKQTVDRLYPLMASLNKRMYADALAAAAPGRIQDFADVLNAATPQFFTDLIHLNEAGNRFIAERIAATVTTRQSANPPP